MQTAPAPAPTSTTQGPPPMFHRAHRCYQEPATKTYCGLLTRGPSLPVQETRKRIPCNVCDDLQGTTCEICDDFRP